MPIASVTGGLTSLVGDHGLYAVFGLMVIDAVLPAASELVMLYAGALAAGAFAGQHVVVFGSRIDSPFWGFVAMSLAGVAGNTVGSVVGWAIGLYGGRALVRVDPRGSGADAASPLHGAHSARLRAVVLRARGRRLGTRLELRASPSRLQVRRHRSRRPALAACSRLVYPPAAVD